MQNLKKLLLVGLLAISFSPVALQIASAQDGSPTYCEDGTDNCLPTSTQDFVDVLGRIFNIGAGILALICGLFILSAAFMYVTSHGDEEKVGQAKNTIIYAVMGLVLAGLAYGIPLVIKNLLFS